MPANQQVPNHGTAHRFTATLRWRRPSLSKCRACEAGEPIRYSSSRAFTGLPRKSATPSCIAHWRAGKSSDSPITIIGTDALTASRMSRLQTSYPSIPGVDVSINTISMRSAHASFRDSVETSLVWDSSPWCADPRRAGSGGPYPHPPAVR